MALLQISEPGASPDPHARRHVVGIDLGTTNSLVAAVRSGVAECLPGDDGIVIVPSLVRFRADGAAQVGADAVPHLVSDPDNTVVSVKRLMGRGRDDLPAGSELSYRLADGVGMVTLHTAAGPRSPVEVSAEILAALRRRAEDTFDAELDGAVVTVPAYFDDAQRQATKDAARLAGLEVLRLVSEPTAAAIAYGLDHASEGLYAIYDLGGGTFDVSLLRLTAGVFEVVATGGDTALGGDDIDAALAEHMVDAAGARLSSAADRRAALLAARRTKEALSTEHSAMFTCDIAGQRIEATVSRADLDRLAAPWIDRTIAAARRVLRDARASAGDVHGVVLVGGATRMPLVRERVRELFGRDPLVDHDPDQVVALGAAIQAEALSGNGASADVLLLDVTPLSLGIETMGDLVERLIPRNTPIPASRSQDFTTFQDGQTVMALHVVQGERELVGDCRSLARFELRGIPPMTAGAARIQVTFAVDADGLLSVSAREQTSGVEASVVVKPSYGLGDDEVARMLAESFSRAEADVEVRALREAGVDADRLLAATAKAVDADADLLSAAQRESIESAAAGLRDARGTDDREAIGEAIDALAAATEEFAGARMNRGIARALSGRSISDV